MAKHLAPASSSPQSAIHRALSRAKGRHGRRRMAGSWVGGVFVPADETAEALFGLEDYSAELAEVRAELSRPINTQAVSA